MKIRSAVALFLVISHLSHPAWALVSFNDGKDKVYVNAALSMGYDSNIYTVHNGDGAMTYSANYGIEYARRAGMIGVDASVSMTSTKFGDASSQNFDNPTVTVELTKQSGRTTGSLLTRISRESRADVEINGRSTAWNYEAGLNARYPVMERYTLAGTLGYSRKDYTSDPALIDLDAYTGSVDTYYAYNSERDLIAGYRYRYSEAHDSSTYTDHAFTVGASGRLLAKLNGNFRIGYQVRVPGHIGDETTSGITVSSSATWTITKRNNITLHLGKDFTTSSRDVTVDATAAGIDTQYTIGARCSIYTGIGGGKNRFIGRLSDGRRDEYFTWNVGGSYALTNYLKGSLGYTYYNNWSNRSIASFTRNSATLTLSTRF